MDRHDAIEIVVFAVGAVVVALTVGSAIRTVVLPRGVRPRLARAVFGAVRALLLVRAGPSPTWERADRVLANLGPVWLLSIVASWVTLSFSGFAAMFWAVGVRPIEAALTLSGSSLFTLGFASASGPRVALVFVEAAIGLTLVALMISYLPAIYTAFSRRELQVTMLATRAGTPPSPATWIARTHHIRGLERLDEVWPVWMEWFADVEESHTSFPALVYFRSPQPGNSWVAAAAAVLDTAALVLAAVDTKANPDANLMIRAGFLSLRRVATLFDIDYDDDPQPGDPISVSRDAFDAVYDELAEAGVPLKADRDQAWRDFAGWRVNYDGPLLGLAAATYAPPSPSLPDRH